MSQRPPTDADRARLRLIVTGRVQGVFFRHATLETARSLALSGWVRNSPNSRQVEIVAEGRVSALNALEAWAHDGPPAARVDHVDAQWSQFTGEFKAFSAH
ncbi:MAG: acylphosphatase [Candidatus Binataceae bacterium]